jgi:EAL domain-containing protein (putative c-di-GMP-specific phosphodiesterase class I)
MSSALRVIEGQHEQTEPGERGVVLLVDDEPMVTKVYARLLVASGFTVEVANDAATAVARCRERKFDVLVSDVSMPNMTGIELLRAVREHDLDLPVVLMTGGPDIESAIEAVEYGAFGYLVKPIPLPRLAQVVIRAARLHEMARVRRQAVELVRTSGSQIGDRAGLESRFASALDSMWLAYQPIVSWSGQSVFAYEALLRCEEPTLRRPDEFLAAADRLGRLTELGRTIRARTAAMLGEGRAEGLSFVNLHPLDLEDDELYSADAPLSAFASRVVLEITERAALDRISDPMARMTRLRSLGFRIAVDDLGAGYAGLNSFAQLEPEVVKVDMSLVRGIDRSVTKQRLLRSIVDLCRDLGIDMVAEGIETVEERDMVVHLGTDLCQGYLFARPAFPHPVPVFNP